MNFRGGIKRDKTDALFSELVRMRVNWICEYCQRDFTENRHGLHCSHVYGRRIQGIRYHPLNAFAHCQSCHEKLGENPLAFAEWVKNQLGESDYNKLQYLARASRKPDKHTKELLHKHYLKERKRIHAQRQDGEMGRIGFTYP